MLEEHATEVEELSELDPNKLYKIKGGDERGDFFTIDDFYWNDEDDNVIAITKQSDLSKVDFDASRVDEQNSFGSIDYFHPAYTNPSIENMRRRIKNGKYMCVGDLAKFRDKIPNK